jgi:hypothetical protein
MQLLLNIGLFTLVRSLTQYHSVAWVRQRNIPTERPPLIGEVSADFCGYKVPRNQCDGSLRPYSRFYIAEPLIFFQVAPELYSQGWVDPIPDSLLLRKPGSAGNRTRTSGSDQIFWELVGLERGQLSLVSTTEELLGRKISGSGLESREYCRTDPYADPVGPLYPQKLTLTSPTKGCRSIGIVRLLIQATVFSFSSLIVAWYCLTRLNYNNKGKSWLKTNIQKSPTENTTQRLSQDKTGGKLRVMEMKRTFCILQKSHKLNYMRRICSEKVV